MRYILYHTKDTDGKPLTVPFYPNEREIEELIEIKQKPRGLRKTDWLFAGQLLNLNRVELLDDDVISRGRPHRAQKIDVRDEAQRGPVKEFERQFKGWALQQLPHQRSPQHYCRSLGYAIYEDAYIASSGFEYFRTEIIRRDKISDYVRFWELVGALSELNRLREYANRKEREARDAMAAERLATAEKMKMPEVPPDPDDGLFSPEELKQVEVLPEPVPRVEPEPGEEEIDVKDIPF